MLLWSSRQCNSDVAVLTGFFASTVNYSNNFQYVIATSWYNALYDANKSLSIVIIVVIIIMIWQSKTNYKSSIFGMRKNFASQKAWATTIVQSCISFSSSFFTISFFHYIYVNVLAWMCVFWPKSSSSIIRILKVSDNDYIECGEERDSLYMPELQNWSESNI